MNKFAPMINRYKAVLMVNKCKVVLMVALCAMCFSSCAKDDDESSTSIQKRILDSYVKVNYPNATKLADGLTILEEKAGTGTKALTSNMVCYVHYNTYSLEGTCKSTTDSVLARHLGTYDASLYYGPTFFVIGTGQTSVGLEELFKRMKKGGYAKAIIPPWLTSYSTSYSGTTSSSQESSVNVIYEVKMGDIISDLNEFQKDSLEAYSNKYFGGLDSTAYGYYFKNYTHPKGVPDADTITANTNVHVWYIGRLLDGYVFDTNIEDTAKKYGIYSSSTTYSALSVEMQEKYTDMTSSTTTSSSSSSDGSVVGGFARALKGMTVLDHATTFFSSAYGYGSTSTMSSGKGVPEYSMLRFDIWMANEDDDDYPPTMKKSTASSVSSSSGASRTGSTSKGSTVSKGKTYQVPFFLKKQ
ncbi:MAG: FKBP-type peptidyl-prolyl cis-trans isomerase [Bacteroidales bacterium]|jgi:FKBP-type peptidyl-prolyl cis-trans isomerase 2|nr:FKBP-type peptidyl-prolyl cis-trans isomerase [Bacteroidales bacterium]MCI1734076.1 FKBP-type peptidyl-prolyl cis-trans isomerase [Bacteroidales bacterium]